MKKILTVIGLLVFTLAGCGKATEEKEVKFSDVMNDKKETISYLVENSSDDSAELGKDSKITKFIVSKDGKIAVYSDYSDEDSDSYEYATDVGKMIKMDDDKKLDYIKKMDKKSFNVEKDYKIKETKDKIESVEDSLDNAKKRAKEDDYDPERYEIEGVPEVEFYSKQLTNLTKELKKISNIKYKEPTFNKLKINITTDGSGNNTKSEFINIGSQTFDEDSKNGIYRYSKESSKNYGVNLSNVVSPTEIYDKKIAGLSNIDLIEEDNDYDEPAYRDYEYLITEVGDKTQKFKLDQPDDKGVKEK
ncbi:MULTISPECIES: hypothetical protein [unclassified Mammaliicoccus]|uniref:hypothetical protein n=1 Tax=unclassified Mammaliicoccus TaxID=2803851 RepID=UPI001952EB81|nr:MULTISPECIES: hypothetical protein [unclassified Mammaliicoccus]